MKPTLVHGLKTRISLMKVHHHHNRFTALFLEPPGRAGARRKLLLDFMVLENNKRQTHRQSGWVPLHPEYQQSTSINDATIFMPYGTLPVYPGLGEVKLHIR